MNHLFLDVHMRISHAGMLAALEENGHELARGDTAIFVNKNWLAVKILTTRRAYIYVREARPMTVEMLIAAPKLVGGHPLVLTGEQRRKLERAAAEAGKARKRTLPKAA